MPYKSRLTSRSKHLPICGLIKIQLTVIFSFFTLFCFAQIERSNDAVYDGMLAYKPATIVILTDTSSSHPSFINNVSRITYLDMKPGSYKIQISGQGQLTTVRDSVIVKEGQKLVLNFIINGPCLYDHPLDYTPMCPRNHKDNIIPIVYGLVASNGDTFVNNRQDMKVKYSGCVMTDCNPRFYCKEHDIQF